MLLMMCKSEFSPLAATATHPWYDGSATIARNLTEAAALLPGRQVGDQHRAVGRERWNHRWT
jgi:hypothetical protein